MILSGYEKSKEEMYLRGVLSQQAFNFRALSQLSNLLENQRQIVEAKALLRIILNEKAYTEIGYGIMNQYINDVLTHSVKEQEIKERAKKRLQQLN